MTKLATRWNHARGFTLVELLIVILIISLLTAMTMTAMSGAVQEGKRQRARVQIAKIDALIMEKWNSYRYRQVPIRITASPAQQSASDYLRTVARTRLYALRELMRMELPDCMDDITVGPTSTIFTTTPQQDPPGILTALPSRPALSQRYLRKVGPTPDIYNQQAECLYLILSEMRDGERSAINFFLDSEIGDTDSDGLKEILDPWGTPIRFLRWAPGYSVGPAPVAGLAPNPALTNQTMDATVAPDPFDPLKVDFRWDINFTSVHPVFAKPFALRPLILSAGPDKEFDVVNGYFNTDGSDAVTPLNTNIDAFRIPNDPYYIHKATSGPNAGQILPWIGSCGDVTQDGINNYVDNITNHDIVLEGQ